MFGQSSGIRKIGGGKKQPKRSLRERHGSGVCKIHCYILQIYFPVLAVFLSKLMVECSEGAGGGC